MHGQADQRFHPNHHPETPASAAAKLLPVLADEIQSKVNFDLGTTLEALGSLAMAPSALAGSAQGANLAYKFSQEMQDDMGQWYKKSDIISEIGNCGADVDSMFSGVCLVDKEWWEHICGRRGEQESLDDKGGYRRSSQKV